MQIDHAAIPVTDVAAARAFYEQALAPLGVHVLAERPSVILLGGGRGTGWSGCVRAPSTALPCTWRFPRG